jgi:hypothetical protein
MLRESNIPLSERKLTKGRLTMLGRFDTLHSNSTGFERPEAEGLESRGSYKGDLAPMNKPVSVMDRYSMQWHGGLSSLPRCARKASLAVLAVLAATSLAACATLGPDSSPESKQKVVTERASARWEALIKGDVDTAYTYFSAGSKATTSLALYKSQIKPGRWRTQKVDSVECTKELCKVSLTITYDMPQMKAIPTLVTENWIIEDGTAGLVYR